MRRSFLRISHDGVLRTARSPHALGRSLCGVFGLLLLLSACSNEKVAPSVQESPDSASSSGASGDMEATCSNCDAPDVCVFGECKSAGTPVVNLGLGSEEGQVGLVQEDEAPVIGPMSFAVRGALSIVLDQSNSRLQGFRKDRFEFEVPLDLATYEDVVFFDAERVVLLNRQGLGSVVLMNLDGTIENRVQLVGLGIGSAGSVAHLAPRSDGVWVEYRDHMVRVLREDGSEDTERRSSQAYLLADNEFQLYTETGERTLYLEKLKRSSSPVTTKRYEYADYVSRTLTVDSDAAGKIYIVLGMGEGGNYRTELHQFSADLAQERTVPLTDDVPGDATFRSLVVTPEGSIYRMIQDGDQIRIRKY